MNSLVDSDIQRFVACLVLGYLENQQLQKAYGAFCETSRHLVKEKLGLKYGNKPLDTSVGLVNIIKEYFLIKSRINEFLRHSPQSPVVIQLIDTTELLQRLDIILNTLKDGLPKNPGDNAKKRKFASGEGFDISQSNTSTPETVNPSKRRRKSLTTPFLTLSANQEVKTKSVEKSFASRPELNYSSTSETSAKEEDGEEEEEEVGVEQEQGGDKSIPGTAAATSPSPIVLKTDGELLSETFLNKPDLIHRVAETINRTREAKDCEASTSNVEFGLTNDDIKNILSVTQNDPSFDEIVNDVINKYLKDSEGEQGQESTTTSPEKVEDQEQSREAKSPSPTIKQRLRQRKERKPQKKDKKKTPAKKTPLKNTPDKRKKITIISNEPYTGVVPAVANLPQVTFGVPIYSLDMFPMMQTIPVLSGGSTMIYQPTISNSPVASTSAAASQILIPTTSIPGGQEFATSSGQVTVTILPSEDVPAAEDKTEVIEPQKFDVVEQKPTTEAQEPTDDTQKPETSQKLEETKVSEPKLQESQKINKQTTPKSRMNPNFLAKKCKSTPRRKQASHVRILDFNLTPSTKKFQTILEQKTPQSSGIPAMTPGSAPASVRLDEKGPRAEKFGQNGIKPEKIENSQPEAATDDTSNSNSISNTPRVTKKTVRRRKINVARTPDEKSICIQDENPVEKFDIDDWNKMRSQAKEMDIDMQQRLANQQVVDKKISRKKRKTPKKRSVSNKRKSRTKSPDDQKENKKDASDEQSTSVEYDENKPLSSIKFKISSPRKNVKATPKKKSKSVVERSKEKFAAHEGREEKKKDQEEEGKELEKDDEKKEEEETGNTTVESVDAPQTTDNPPEPPPNDLNPSEQEVATVLFNLHETILSKDKSEPVLAPAQPSPPPEPAAVPPEPPTYIEITSNIGFEELNTSTPLFETPFKGVSDLLETPFKDATLTPLPNTPRFAIPIASDTPMPKIFATTSSCLSIVKICDIQTPNFPITPGIKETPPKDATVASPNSGGYVSRKTDYSSCSSYYKPDESEEINQNFEQKRKSERTQSQSESESERPLKIVGSARKVECPGAIDLVDNRDTTPHYNMMDDGVLSESIVTTATEDGSSNSSSSVTTCSTCSSGSSSEDEDTMTKLKKVVQDEKDSEWRCDNPEVANPAEPAVDQKTGEVRFPIRHWITPKKVEPEAENNQAEIERLKTQERLEELKLKKERTLQKLRSDSEALKPKFQQHKFKRSQVKNFKLPPKAEFKQAAPSRKEQILNQNFTERPRPTPLKLIPSTSSSRRKNATPRKTIALTELPRQPTPVKKKKTPPAPPALESVTDNAVMPETVSQVFGSNISTSFNSSFEDESACTVVAKTQEVESNTFQKTLVEQGFEEDEAKKLQDMVNNIKNGKQSESEESEDEVELDVCSAVDLEKNLREFKQPDNFPCSILSISNHFYVSDMIFKYDNRQVKIGDSGPMEIFSQAPVEKVVKKRSPKKPAEKEKEKEKEKEREKEKEKKKKAPEKQPAKKNGKAPVVEAVKEKAPEDVKEKASEKPKIKINIKNGNRNTFINNTDISAILDKVHGK